MVFSFADNTTVLNATNLTKLLDWSGSNLVMNSSFEDWNTDSTPIPVGWVWVANTATITKETTITFLKHGLSSVKIVKTGGSATTLSQPSPAGAYYCQQRTLTAGAWINCNSALACQLYIDDGITKSYSSHHTGGGSFEWLTVTKTGATGATKTAVGISIGNVSTTYVDGVILVPGEVDCPYTPGPDTTFVWNLYRGSILSITGSGDVDLTAVDVPSVTSNWCRDGTLAVLCRVAVNDSGFAAGTGYDAYLFIRPKGDADPDTHMYIRPRVNGRYHECQVWIPLDSGGEFEYSVTATGSNTFNGEVRPFGYLRPI